MKKSNSFLWLLSFLFFIPPVIQAKIRTTVVTSSTEFHMGYLWHLHQPIYWPSPISAIYPRMERAWETIQKQDQGRQHPNPEKLREIFSVDDRIAVYQWRLVDAINSISFHPLSGAQVSYSGSLLENIISLGEADVLGYSPTWINNYRNFTPAKNAAQKSKLDFVNFTFHHSLAPLISPETLEMEIRLHQYIMKKTFNTESRGYFPTEMAFTPSMIPILKKLGITWTVIGNNHLARSSKDYPVIVGSGGENCDLPNKADQLNPNQGSSNYIRMQIDRGISPAAPAPFAFYPHKALYIDPQTGSTHTIDAIPADQALSWKDGYSSWDINLTESIRSKHSDARPPFFLLAHDGDNAWGGGFSYYQEWVKNLGEQTKSKNISISTVESYLEKYPIPSDDLVHVESGSWVNAESDFGSPQFINWHWPPSYKASGGIIQVDPSQGVSDKADFWRVNLATENSVKTAQQISGKAMRLEHVLNPVASDTAIEERAWHFYLGGLDSGFVYYGCHGDECERAVEAQKNAIKEILEPLADSKTKDKIGPTLFPPQRHPWNPGSKNFGVQYNYRITEFNKNDFFIWTYGFDVNDIKTAKVVVRFNGHYSPANRESQLYAASNKLGTWQNIELSRRVVDTVLKVKPDKIADYYWTQIKDAPVGYADYYIEAEDTIGNKTRSGIQHVYIGKPNL
jgi:hypothetical protein